MKEIKDIIILGGGTSGLLSALMIKEGLNHCNIKIIKSSKIGIIGVGESITEHWSFFEEYVGLDYKEVINSTDATLKIGTLFKEWNGKNTSYVHSTNSSNVLTSILGIPEIYNHTILEESQNPYCLTPLFDKFYSYNQIPIYNNFDSKITQQYNFDSFKLNEYLLSKCKEKGIKVEDHYIEDINLDIEGNVSSLVSKENVFIKGDFFIDCSGFNKKISKKLKIKTLSFKDYLPTNRAFVLNTDIPTHQEIEPYIVNTALKNGWVWKTPTQFKYGNGYVFSDNHTTPQSALEEFTTHLNLPQDTPIKDIQFEPTKLEKHWVNNCISIGLSSNFTEPLEAQSLSFTIIQLQKFLEYYNQWIFNPLVSKKYNQEIDKIFNNIVDYIQLHYLTKRKDSNFWKNKPFKLTDFNQDTLSRFSKGYFSISDFNFNDTLIFNLHNFYQVYFGLGLLTLKDIRNYVNTKSQKHNDYWYAQYKSSKLSLPKSSISHRNYLNSLKF